MEFLLDTANIDMIKKAMDIIPITGVTSNPSIIKREKPQDFFAHMKEIRMLIGNERTLHIQVTRSDTEGMIKDAEIILEKIDHDVYIKVPVTAEGLKAIRYLKKEKVNVTATAIYGSGQGLLAIEAGADYIAPYYNRMENLDIDSEKIISGFSKTIETYKYSTKILAASFKNMSQINKAFLAGAHCVTLDPNLILDMLSAPHILNALNDFE